MTIDPNSKSYPFLALAQRTCSDYGDVLSYADLVENPTESTYWRKLARYRLTEEVVDTITSMINDLPGYTYWICEDCGFDAVTRDSELPTASPDCPLCSGDCGRDVPMTGRTARTTDVDVEGKDARR